MSRAPAFDTPALIPGARRGRPVAATVVITAHVLVLLAWWLSTRHALWRPVVASATSITIRLIPERQPRANAAASRAPAAAPTPPTATLRIPALTMVPPVPAQAASAATPEVTTQADASTTSEAPAGARIGLDGGAAAPGPGHAASGPGGLALKPGKKVMMGSLANPAVNDPRSNTPKPTFEERIAMGLDPSLCIKVEQLPDGTLRRTMGHWSEVPSSLDGATGGKSKPVRVCR